MLLLQGWSLWLRAASSADRVALIVAVTVAAEVVVTTAIAREMVGFLLAIARQVEMRPAA